MMTSSAARGDFITSNLIETWFRRLSHDLTPMRPQFLASLAAKLLSFPGLAVGVSEAGWVGGRQSGEGAWRTKKTAANCEFLTFFHGRKSKENENECKDIIIIMVVAVVNGLALCDDVPADVSG